MPDTLSDDRCPPTRFNAARYCLAENARLRPDKTALVMVGDGSDTRLTFGAVERAVRGIAAGLLGLGLKTGDRVMIRMGNEADYVLVYFGALAAGLVALPSSPQLTEGEAAFLRENSGAAAVVVGSGCAIAPEALGGRLLLDATAIGAMKAGPPLPGFADTAADDPAMLIYTSGTTSRPKGVLHAHRAAYGRRPMLAHWLGLTESDVMLHAGTMNWTYTLGVGLSDPWSVGATAVLYNGPRDPAVWPRLIAAHGATLFAAVPTLYRQILKYGDLAAHDLSNLRHGCTAGEPLPIELLDAWQQATGKPLYEALGMSEISTYISSGPTIPVRPGSPGKPQPGRRVAILPVEGEPVPLPAGESGLLAVHRSEPALMLGYWNRPEETAKVMTTDGYFRTGDIGVMDADGFTKIVDRKKDMILVSGFNVYPNEGEEVIAGHPGVLECAVIGVPDEKSTEAVKAFVVKKDPNVTAQDIIKFAATQLTNYKVPKQIEFRTELPKTNVGKILRRELRDDKPKMAAAS